MRLKYLILFTAFQLICLLCFGQKKTCYVTCNSKKIKINRAFELLYTINAIDKKITAKYTTSNDVAIIDSLKLYKITKNNSIYKLIVMPKTAGKIESPNFEVMINNQNIVANKIELIVGDTNEIELSEQEQKILDDIENNNSKTEKYLSNENKQTTEAITYNGNQLYIAPSISNQNPYVGEQVTVNYYLYAKADAEIEPISYPKIFGCWIRDITNNDDAIAIDTVVNNGSRYLRYLLYSLALFPSSAGKKLLPSFTITCKAQIALAQNQHSEDGKIANTFGFEQVEKKHVSISSKEISFNAKSLPNYGNNNFTNICGDYTIKVKIDTARILSTSSVILNYQIKGTGNLSFAENISQNFGYDWEVGEPKIKDTSFFEHNILQNEKTYTYILVPMRSGIIAIPALYFTYFSKNTYEYINDTVTPINIEVINAKENKLGDVNTLNEILMHQDKPKEYLLFYNYKYWLFYLLPIALLLSAYFYKNIKIKQIQQIQKVALGNTTYIKLQVTKSLLDSKNYQAYCSEILQILNIYFSEKLRIEKASLNKNKIINALQEKQISTILIEQYDTIEKKCTAYVFAKIGNEQEIENTHEQVIALINETEQSLNS